MEKDAVGEGREKEELVNQSPKPQPRPTRPTRRVVVRPKKPPKRASLGVAAGGKDTWLEAAGFLRAIAAMIGWVEAAPGTVTRGVEPPPAVDVPHLQVCARTVGTRVRGWPHPGQKDWTRQALIY